MQNKKISVLGDHDLVFFRFGSFNSICQNSHSTFHQTAGTSFFFTMHLLAVHTAAIDSDFNDFQWISDMVVSTDAEYSNTVLMVQTIMWFVFKPKSVTTDIMKSFCPLNYVFM